MKVFQIAQKDRLEEAYNSMFDSMFESVQNMENPSRLRSNPTIKNDLVEMLENFKERELYEKCSVITKILEKLDK